MSSICVLVRILHGAVCHLPHDGSPWKALLVIHSSDLIDPLPYAGRREKHWRVEDEGNIFPALKDHTVLCVCVYVP